MSPRGPGWTGDQETLLIKGVGARDPVMESRLDPWTNAVVTSPVHKLTTDLLGSWSTPHPLTHTHWTICLWGKKLWCWGRPSGSTDTGPHHRPNW